VVLAIYKLYKNLAERSKFSAKFQSTDIDCKGKKLRVSCAVKNMERGVKYGNKNNKSEEKGRDSCIV